MTPARNSVLTFATRLLGLIAAAVALGLARPTLAQDQPPVQPNPLVLASDPSIEYAPNTVLIKVKPGALLSSAPVGAGSASVQAAGEAGNLPALLQTFGATAVEPLFAPQLAVSAANGVNSVDAANAAGAQANSALANLYRVTLAPGADVPTAAQALSADSAVLYSEPDYVARPALTPNDPELGGQWALGKIGALAAWDVTTGSPDVVIAIIDSGVDLAHEEFGGRLWVNPDEIADNGVDDDLNGYVDDVNGWNFVSKSKNIADSSGHGTQVGGVAGAASDNGVGIAGLCWQCRLMFVNAMQPSGAANYSDIASAVAYASSNGAHIINLSLGGYADSQALREAITEAAVTTLVVAGAGNDDSVSPFYPAAYPQVMAVAATDADDHKPVFSNYGPWVDISAPGEGIRTPALGANAYVTSEGTSLSTAFVSGLAGLLKSRNPGWSAEQVRWQILNTAYDIDAANPAYAGQLGSGRIDAQAALATTPLPQLAVTSYTLDGAAGARPEPGKSYALVVTLENTWLPASNLVATLSSSDPYVQIADASGAYGSLPGGQSASNAADPFSITLAGNTPYNRTLAFTLNLSGSGGYATSIPLNIQVRSSVYTLGNTQYTTSTVTTPDKTVVWTNDKTWVLDGSVIVGQGVTLTIQPGTVVKVAPGKFIRIDGTLIAAGTAEQPIVFAAKTEGGRWSGIRFTATAVDAIFDAGGGYAPVTGSYLRGVRLSFATTAISIAGPGAPLIIDSAIESSSWAIDSKAAHLHVVRSIIEDVEIAVHISAGTLSVIESEVLDSNCGIWTDSVGSDSTIYRSRFEGNEQVLEDYTGTVVIRESVFVNNGRVLYVIPGRSHDISGNLFANNSGNAVSGCMISDRATALHINLDSSVLNTGIRHNTFINNAQGAVSISGCSGQCSSANVIEGNNFVLNGKSELVVADGTGGHGVSAVGNYWSVPVNQVPSHIDDCTFDENGCGAGSTKGKVLWDPPLATPDQVAPAFVTNITMSPNPVGLERGTLTVDFSRPMSTSIVPTVWFEDITGTATVFDNVAWVSATQLSAERVFDPLTPAGVYTVHVDAAMGADSMPAAPSSQYTFTVAHAGGVTVLPPLPPTVQAAATGSLTTISASWSPNGAGITQYRHAIGTSPSARNVVGWTYLAANSMQRTDLHLVSGQTYYVTVRARNATGLWSEDGVSNPVVALNLPMKVFLPNAKR